MRRYLAARLWADFVAQALHRELVDLPVDFVGTITIWAMTIWAITIWTITIWAITYRPQLYRPQLYRP